MNRFRRVLFLFILFVLISGCNPVAKDPRPQGQTLESHLNETVSTAFFQFRVSNLSVGRNLNNYLPEDREALLLVCELGIENVGSESLPMSYADFLLRYVDPVGKEQNLYPLEPFLEDQLPDTYTLKAGQQLSGKLVFQIPKSLKKGHLVFQEVYEDDYIGNLHQILLELP